MEIGKLTAENNLIKLTEDSYILEFNQTKTVNLEFTNIDSKAFSVKGVCSCTTINTVTINDNTLQSTVTINENARGKVILLKNNNIKIAQIEIK